MEWAPLITGEHSFKHYKQLCNRPVRSNFFAVRKTGMLCIWWS